MQQADELSMGRLPVWQAGPARPSLRPGLVDVWRADLEGVGDAVLAWLAPDERERCARILDLRKGERWARARGLLRGLLGRYLDCEPGELAFAAQAAGKPRVASPANGTGLSFSVSHSGKTALYAFALGSAVGVDVETRSRSRPREMAIAARVLGEREARRLGTLVPDEASRQFLQGWARWEAVRKCTGEGIWERPAGSQGAPQWHASRPWISAIALGAHAAGALAVEHRPRALRCWVAR